MIILASSSTTRADILREFGIEFIQKGVDFDEDSLKYTTPKEFVYYATLGKFDTAVKKFGIKTPLLVADTVVTADNQILRKAKNRDDAKRILKLQSGNRVSIITCMIYKSKSKEFLDLSTTDYIFEKFDEDELKEYLNGEEWVGKAGACMVEGFCQKYIKEVIGLESIAKGLGIEKLLPFLD